MPPRWAPYAYQSPGANLIRLPGCRKLRGTQVGVSRSKPPPASNAESRMLPTLSLVTMSLVEIVAVAMITAQLQSKARPSAVGQTIPSKGLVLFAGGSAGKPD